MGSGPQSSSIRTAAAAKRTQYIAATADNIVRVHRNGVIESETEYEVWPQAADFDHAIAQRYGGSQIQSTANGWESGYPTFNFQYVSAGPEANGGDRTEELLPASIQRRYALERMPTEQEAPAFYAKKRNAQAFRDAFEDPGSDWQDFLDQDTVCASSAPPEKQDCWMGGPAGLNTVLPGYRELLPYFDVPDADGRPRAGQDIVLKRSRLTCGQLAEEQVSNPAHNANLLLTREKHTVAENPEVSYDFWQCQDWRPNQAATDWSGVPDGARDGQEDQRCCELARTVQCTARLGSPPDALQAKSDQARISFRALVPYELAYDAIVPDMPQLRPRCVEHSLDPGYQPSRTAQPDVEYERYIDRSSRDKVAQNSLRI